MHKLKIQPHVVRKHVKKIEKNVGKKRVEELKRQREKYTFGYKMVIVYNNDDIGKKPKFYDFQS